MDNTLDSLARELAHIKPRPRDEDERRRDVADEMSLLPLLQAPLPLPLALAALRWGKPGQAQPVPESGRSLVKPEAPDDVATGKLSQAPEVAFTLGGLPKTQLAASMRDIASLRMEDGLDRVLHWGKAGQAQPVPEGGRSLVKPEAPDEVATGKLSQAPEVAFSLGGLPKTQLAASMRDIASPRMEDGLDWVLHRGKAGQAQPVPEGGRSLVKPEAPDEVATGKLSQAPEVAFSLGGLPKTQLAASMRDIASPRMEDGLDWVLHRGKAGQAQPVPEGGRSLVKPEAPDEVATGKLSQAPEVAFTLSGLPKTQLAASMRDIASPRIEDGLDRVLHRGKAGQAQPVPEGGRSLVKPEAPDEVATGKLSKAPTEPSTMDKLYQVPVSPLAGKVLGGGDAPVVQRADLEQASAGVPAKAITRFAWQAGPTRPALAASTVVRMEAGERKPRHESAVPPLRVLPLAPHIAPHGRGEPAAGRKDYVRHELAPTQTVSGPPTLQSGLTYRFSSWGGEHAVTVQGPAGGSLLLQPSDALVAQRLSEQWQSGNPQQWQLARDSGEGREQRQPQQHEEDEA
ncbi:SpaN/EivJ family type III secretion system needle length determinant [Chromobacterium amazonense]|uniref:SpaN/EivJ family type III secretion system needle length determinant n=1 Tax=Chromobacterium amazonense TaxID=1382803 RepID=UPI003F7A0E0C